MEGSISGVSDAFFFERLRASPRDRPSGMAVRLNCSWSWGPWSTPWTVTGWNPLVSFKTTQKPSKTKDFVRLVSRETCFFFSACGGGQKILRALESDVQNAMDQLAMELLETRSFVPFFGGFMWFVFLIRPINITENGKTCKQKCKQLCFSEETGLLQFLLAFFLFTFGDCLVISFFF